MENKQEQELLLLIQNTQQFPDSQILKAKGVEDIFVSVMTGLKDAAVAKIKEKATGWIMNLLGMGPGPDPLDEIKRQLNEQAAELKKINDKIDDLQRSLNKALSEILDAMEKGQYDAAVRGLNPVIAKITSRYERLSVMVKTSSPDPSEKAAIDRFAAEIISEIPEAFDAIHATLVGTSAGEENLMDFWARLSFKNTGTLDLYEQTIFYQFMYYYGLQVKALMLVMEAYHTMPNGSKKAEYYFNLWGAKLNEEIRTYLKNAPRTTIKQQLDVKGNPVSIVPYGNNVYYTTGEVMQNPPAPRLITLQKPGYTEIDVQVPQDTQGVFHMMRKGEYAYLAALQAVSSSGGMAWHFMKVKLGGKPQIEKVITCHTPGEGPFRMGFPNASVCDDTTMYAMFSGSTLNGFAFVAIDLASFSFVDKGGIARRNEAGRFGDLGGNGGALYGNYFFTTALSFASGPVNPDKNTLFTIDLITKKIVSEALLSSVSMKDRVYNEIHQPMAIQGKYLYCCAGDTTLRVIDISSPMQPKVVTSVDTGSFISEIYVNGGLIYFTSCPGADLFGDDRGIMNVAFFTSRTNNTVLLKSAKIGEGIHALGMDEYAIYAGSGRGQSKIYVLGYGNDLTKNIIPIQETVLAAHLEETGELAEA